ncbi:MAG: HAMP domain-containing methyl-accepting chemotaxis protein [Negativicutes bacterium]|nr:HAMP domain-containing methyl-accepting chemotaxis protein [Negativicutes bacterium]
MKIRTKIYCGFAVIIAVMAVMVAVFFYQYRQIERATADILEYRMMLLDSARKLQIAQMRTAAATRGYLMTGDARFADDLAQAAKAAEAEADYLVATGREQQTVRPIKQALQDFAPHRSRILELYQSQGQAAAADYLVKVGAPANAALNTLVDNYTKRQEEARKTAVAEIQNIQTRLYIYIYLLLAFGVLAGLAVAYFTTRPIMRAITVGQDYAEHLAQGDLSQEIGVVAKDEMGALLTYLNQASRSLRSLIRQVAAAAEQVASSSAELSSSAEQSAQAAGQVAGAITEAAQGTNKQMEVLAATTAAVDTMSANIAAITQNAGQVETTSTKAAQAARDGDKAVAEAVRQMANVESTVAESAAMVGELGEKSNQIGQIVATIAGIAGQTNLLALNAAIEAARAGEQGRGFAVVAEEVRKLAEQSELAAKQIAELIGEIQGTTGKAVAAMVKGTEVVQGGSRAVIASGQSFDQITGLVAETSREIQGMVRAIQELSGGARAVVEAVGQTEKTSKAISAQTQTVSAATEEQTASMEEIAASSEALTKMAEELKKAVSKFRL